MSAAWSLEGDAMVTKNKLLGTMSAIEFHDELLEKGWPDDQRVAALAGKAPGSEATTFAIRAQVSGDLLGVWPAPRYCLLYPDFQFDRSGAIRKDVARLLAVLAGEDDRGGWRRTFWLYSPHALLNDRTPAEIFIDDARDRCCARGISGRSRGDLVNRQPAPARAAGRIPISRMTRYVRGTTRW